MVRGVGPNWYRSAWAQRHPILVDAATGGSSGAVNISVVVPAAWDLFWNNIQDTTSGLDIVVTDSDGRTVLDYDFNGFSYANRTLTIRIGGYTLNGTGKQNMLWLYWNSASTVALGSPTTTSPISGYIELGKPSGPWLVFGRPLTPGQTAPPAKVSKHPSGTIHIYWDVTDILLTRSDKAPYNGKTGYEGISTATASVMAGGSSSVSDAATRFLQAEDRLYVRTVHTGGGDGTTDTVYLALETEPGSAGSSARTLYLYAQIVNSDGA